MPQESKALTTTLGVAFAVLLAVMVGAFIVGASRDDESVAGRMENAAEEVADGVEDAAKELQKRSPREKVEDTLEDTKEAIEDSTK